MKRFSSLTLLLLACAPAALAQPDVNNAPKAMNPQNRRPADIGQRQKLAQDDKVRNQLKRLGITDEKQLDAIVAFSSGESAARDALMDKGTKLSQALRNDALTTTQMAAALNDYEAALEDDKARHDTALAALQKKVDYSKSPRLEAWLTLTGLVGNGPEVIPNGQRRARVRETVRVNGKDPKDTKDAKPDAPAPAAAAPQP